MSTTRPGGLYPAQSNIQTTWDMRDQADAVAQLSGTSRAEVMRKCLARALGDVMAEHRIGLKRMREVAAQIAAERSYRDVQP